MIDLIIKLSCSSHKTIAFFVLFTLQLSLSVVTIGQSQSQHKIHIVLNQDKYAIGETIFIKAYFLNSNLKGVEGKHLMSIFLVDNRGSCRQSIRFNLLGGVGYNQLALSDSLGPGLYRVVGYVFPAEENSRGYIISRTITIVNENIISNESRSMEGVYDSIPMRSGPVAMTVEKNTVKKKSKVKVTVVANDFQGMPVGAEFSVTVFNKALGVNSSVYPMDKAIVGAEGGYFQVTNKLNTDIESTTMDQLSKLIVFQRTGKVFNAETGEPVSDNTQVLFYLQRSEWYHQTFTLNGSVRLNLPQFVGRDELFYLGESPRGRSIPIKVEWEMLLVPKFEPFSPGAELSTQDKYASFVKKMRVIQESFRAFSSNTTKESAFGKTDEPFDLIEPDHLYEPDKYIPFKTMSEMILEVIPAMYCRGSGRSKIVRLTLPDPMTSTSDPVYFIDGWATTSTEYFLSLNPSDLEYIGIVKEPKKLLPLKLLGKNGIVVIKSKMGKVIKPPAKYSEVLDGINPLSEFSQSIEKDAPEFRSTICWFPTVTTDGNGRASFDFYTTDDVGEMVIQLEGVTKNGQPFLNRLPIIIR